MSAGGGVSLHISLALERVKLALPASVTSSFEFIKLNSIDTVVVWIAQLLRRSKNGHFISGRCVCVKPNKWADALVHLWLGHTLCLNYCSLAFKSKWYRGHQRFAYRVIAPSNSPLHKSLWKKSIHYIIRADSLVPRLQRAAHTVWNVLQPNTKQGKH